MSDLILKPGDDPPSLIPYCQRCDQPCESFRFDVNTTSDHIGIHSSCCGYQSSTRITLAVYREMAATGKKLYTIVRKGSTAGLRGRARTLRSVGH